MPDTTMPALEPADLARLPKRLRWEVFGACLMAGDLTAAAATLAWLRENEAISPLRLRAEERLALAEERSEAAVAAAQRRLELFPSAEHQADHTLRLLASGRLEEAEAASASGVTRYPRAAAVWAARGAVALARGDLALARWAMGEASALDPDYPGCRHLPVRLALAEDNVTEAEAMLARHVAAVDDATGPGSLADLAEAAEALGQADVADSLRGRVATYWERRHAATWRAVAERLGKAAGLASPISENRASQPLLTADVPRPAQASLPISSDEEVELPEEVMVLVRERFGHAGLRPGQARVIARALAGIDTLAVMPTGAGKSLCYQVAALALPGTTVVISPLIALMKDQLDSLPASVAAVSTVINSTLGGDEVGRRLDALRRGEYKLLYVAPERLRQNAFLRALRAAGARLLVVDEAHCISLWGHDFRPDYLLLPRAAAMLGDPPLLAMTATATPALADDIERQMRRPLARARASVFRPNLRYEARHLANKESKLRALVQLCREASGPAIVYASSRELCEQLARLLQSQRVQATYYHAGLEREERARIQDDFMSGRARVIVATIAFGMGVDKRDVRLLVHFSPSKSLEAYAQESGRAGRDGLPSRCVLLYSNADITNLRRWARSDEVGADHPNDLHAALRRRERQSGSRWLILEPADLLDGDEADDRPDAQVMIGVLERAGGLTRHPDAPRLLTVCWRARAGRSGDPALDRLAALCEERDGGADEVTLPTAQVAAALDLEPAGLEQRLDEWREAGILSAWGQDRLTCLELLPEPAGMPARLRAVLERARVEAERRFEALRDYLDTPACRHAALAQHFGERLEPCGDACDRCLERRAGKRVDRAAPVASSAATRNDITADDALAVLLAVRALPFPMGKSGLTRLLHGSIASSVREDRSAQFGALAHLSGGRVGALIERLIETGFLARDEGHEYRLLSVTAAGRAATADDLADLIEPAPATRGGATGGRARVDDEGIEEWGEDQHALFERLRQWRAEQASAQRVPPYVIMPDSALRGIVVALPRERADLAAIKGLGPARIDRYGADIVRIILDAASP